MEDELSPEEFARQRRWKLLLIIGVCLNALVVFTSDLGLDTHLHLTYATVEGGQGEAYLDWGHTRPIDTKASDPSYAPVRENGWFQFIGDSPMDVRLLSFTVTLGFIGLLYKQDKLELAALVALYPTFIFSTGRGYPEVFIAAMLYATTILVMQSCREEDENKARIRSLAISVPMAAVLAIKGMSMWYGLAFGFGALIWFELARQHDGFCRWASQPTSVAMSCGLGVASTLLVMGYFGISTTLGVVGDAPARFASALLISVLDVVIIYSLLGMVLWPFIGPAIQGMKEVTDLETASIAGMVAAFTAAITVYVAALWTYESLLWQAEWPWVTATMGNNGRYISLMMIPAYLLLSRLNHLNPSIPCLERPMGKYSALMVGIALIMPLSVLAAVHGQTMWTDDASEIMQDNIEKDEDFLFVAPATLGMHWLYTFHYDIDPYGNNNITGHWRADSTDWHDELRNGTTYDNRGNLANVQWIIIAPNAGNAPEGFHLVADGDADYLNGGGTWEVYTNHDSIIAV